MTTKNKRTCFSIAKKVEIFEKVQKGESWAELCHSEEIASSSLHTFNKDGKKIRAEFESETQNVESSGHRHSTNSKKPS